jgi:hypothetical protein
VCFESYDDISGLIYVLHRRNIELMNWIVSSCMNLSRQIQSTHTNELVYKVDVMLMR